MLSYKLTQGTVIKGIRSSKYPDICCYGVVISARCDLENCKIPKFYYLTAVDLDNWITTAEGFRAAFMSKRNEIEDKLQKRSQGLNLSWDVLGSRSVDEFRQIVNDKEIGIPQKEASKFEEDFLIYKQCADEHISDIDRRSFMLEHKSNIISCLGKISNGQIIHYCFIPQSAYEKEQCKNRGIIVDLQELEQISMEDAERICKLDLDCKNSDLSAEEIRHYNKKFFLEDEPGYVIPEYDISSPWIEYLMQRFAHSFTRIGVDGPNKNDFNETLNRI